MNILSRWVDRQDEFSELGVTKIVEQMLGRFSVPFILEGILDDSLNVKPVRLPPIFASKVQKKAFYKIFDLDDFRKFEIIYGEVSTPMMVPEKDLGFWSRLALGWRQDILNQPPEQHPRREQDIQSKIDSTFPKSILKKRRCPLDPASPHDKNITETQSNKTKKLQDERVDHVSQDQDGCMLK